MNQKQLTAAMAKRCGRDAKEISALLTALTVAIREGCADLDQVAIPGFGAFDPEKHEEHISTDLSTGKQMLLPPEITVKFNPSALLRKKVADSK